MRIALDCHLLYESGIGTQTRGLLTGWAELKRNGQVIPEFTFIGNEDKMKSFPLLQSVGMTYPTSHPPYSWRGRLLFPRLRGVAGTHYLNYHVPAFLWKQPYIVTAHDLIPMIKPEWLAPGVSPWRVKVLLPRILRGARHIITPSEFSASDLTRRLQIPRERITVVPNAVFESWQPISEQNLEAVRQRYKLPRTYFLTVSVNNPHKNLRWLIDSFSSWSGAKDISLVIVGAKPTSAFAINDYLAQKPASNVINLGYIEGGDLSAIYQGAHGLIFPSLYEGFGIPVIEAQRLGVPVIASNVSSLPEVGGTDGALYFDPNLAETLHEQLDRVQDATVRETLITAGYSNERRYTWERSAAMTTDVYNNWLS